ncbi:hypothetical protein ACIRU8_38975 [Streptomyces sp. NPDC101175]|uniref:hypothetical protein n=1 Tax=Streptomyces sp. NPDC101175 TaxID=3366123 RepID=UPI0038335D94
MLRVEYETSHELEPDEIVKITETRGRVAIELRTGTLAADYIPPLNAALEKFVGQCGWFQIWRGEIVSAASPESPLTVRYIADDDVDLRSGVQIREDRGIVRLHVCPTAPADLMVRFLNPAIAKFLAGKQWFQLWQGEIVTMDSPETVSV